MDMNDFEDLFKLNVFNDCTPDFEAVWNTIMVSNEKAVNKIKEDNETFRE